MRWKNVIQLCSSGYIIIIIIIIIITTIVISVIFFCFGKQLTNKGSYREVTLNVPVVMKLQIKALHHICDLWEGSYSLLC